MTLAKLAVIGLPASGKTTYLAALWHLIGSDEVECRLKLDQFRGNLAYLNRIAERWRTFRPLRRTSQVGDADVTLHLIDAHTAKATTVFFPDVAGEAFDVQIESRQCQPSLVTNVEYCDGVMLFISSDLEEDDVSITDMQERLPTELLAAEIATTAATNDVPSSNAANLPASEKASAVGTPLISNGPVLAYQAAKREWTPKETTAQGRIVQILMDLLRDPFERHHRRIAIVLSAWDLVQDVDMTPATWFQHNLPLVHQYLLGNPDAFSYLVYGVSAQGVPLDDAAEVERAAKLPSSERILIVSANGSSHDITVPLIWLASS